MQAVCTAVSMLACLPLGELFFFHIILIRKVGCDGNIALKIALFFFISVIIFIFCWSVKIRA